MDPTPDKEHPDEKPPSRGTADESSEERKFWGMDDDEDHLAPSEEAPNLEDSGGSGADSGESREDFDQFEEDSDESGEDSRESEVSGAEESEEDVESDGDLADPDEEDDPLDEDLDDEEDAPLDEDLDDEEGDPLDDDLEEVLDDLEEPEEEQDVAEKPDSPPPPAETAPEPGGLRISRTDAIWMGVLGVLLLGLAIFAIGIFKSNINTVGSPDDVDFPVKGQKIVIGKVSTHWRKPDLSIDRVKLESHLIPCAVLKLKSGSGSGRLRLFFENPEGDYIGDPISLEFSDGVFSSSGSAEVTVNATGGFEHEGEYNAYVAEKMKFWYLNILEGPPVDGTEGKFEKIVRLRVSPKRL